MTWHPRSNDDLDDLIEPLAPLRDILLEYDLWHQAAFIEQLVLTAESDRNQFIADIGGGMMWGSAGSVFDVFLPSRRSGAESDQRRYEALLRQVAEGLVRRGDPTGNATFAADVLRGLD